MAARKDKRQRQESANDENAKTTEEILKENWMENISKQTQLLGQILEALVDVKEDIKIIKTRSAESSEKIFDLISNKSNTLTEEFKTFCSSQLTMIQQIENSSEEETCSKRLPNWPHFLRDRKNEYWKQLKNEKMAQTYTKWHESTPPVIPRKFRPKIIKGEKEASKKVRMEMAVNKMKSEVKILNIKSNDQKQQFETVDRKVYQMIDERFPDNQNLRAKYKSYWTEQCRLEEEKSQDIFQKKKEWFENLELEGDTENATNNNNTSGSNLEGHDRNSRFNRAPKDFRKPKQSARYNQVRGTYRNVNTPNENGRTNKAFDYNNQSNRQGISRNQPGRSTREEQWNPNTAATKQRPQLSRENSITDEIVENFPTEIHRTFSDSFLP